MLSREDAASDNGTVFIRENGELRCVNEPTSRPVAGDGQYERTKRCRLFDRSFSVKLCMENVCDAQSSGGARRLEHFVFTYTKEGSLRYSAKSLFSMCLLFIADNVQHVDSLLGFPEQMAERLFTAAEEKRKFSHGDTGLKALQIFTEAYGDLVLKSLCLRNRFLLVSEKLEEIKMFRSLQTLDLFGCKLGDSHEILSHLTSEAMSSLTQLYLGDNCLSDSGLRKLTAPVRVMRRGLGNLQLLDLSYNPISEETVRYLSCFSNLRGLDISGTKVEVIPPESYQLNASEEYRIKSVLCEDRSILMFYSPFQLGELVHQILHDTMGFVFSETPMKDFCHSSCKTQGWAEQVVNQWEVYMSELSKPKKGLQSRTDALRFYGRKFFHEKREVPPLNSKISDGTNKRIQFYKPIPNGQTQPSADTKHLTVTVSHKKRKRSLGSRQKDFADSDCSGKHQSVLPLTAEDWDLLNSY
ncbi:leucine-rich repeat-containing protein 42 isoform X1 [Scleropages formosus]|uniref:leucine-rich repeat-containing protein 42 isoform X1 n=1 Tax=Scleropages formosus TaxID=113540 RepID=UPI0008784216|nr:leucine-rich repeat-containing protein 42 isoform X1 [Scleropages formosus]